MVGEVSQPLTSADLNTWKHVAMTFDGTTLRLYVGGVLIRSAPGAHTTTNVPLLFGRWTPAAEYWNGLIDEVRIYGGVLSQGEIQTDMGGPGDGAQRATDRLDDVAIERRILCCGGFGHVRCNRR